MNQQISVIIPAFNAERTIEKCLKSILESTKVSFELEVIVVNNNSTDKTCELVEKFPIRLIHETKVGPAHARNAGAKNASGKYLAFLDADTYIDKDWFIEILKVMSDPLVGGACGQIFPCQEEGSDSLNEFRYRMIKESSKGTFNILEHIVRESPMINSAACFYLKEAFEFVGGFEARLIRHEDIDLSKRICVAGYDLALSDRAKCYVQFHGEGWRDYFKRSYLHGFYKNDYIARWSQGIKIEGELEKPVETDSHKKVFKKQSYANSWWAVRNIVKFLTLAFIKKDNYWIKLLLVDLFRICGQLKGHRRRSSFTPVINKLLPLEKRRRIVKINNNEIELSRHIRVIRTPSPYVFSIERGCALELKENNAQAAFFLLEKYIQVDTSELYQSESFKNTLKRSYLI